MASLKKQNLEFIVLIVEGDEWVDEGDSTDEEVKRMSALWHSLMNLLLD